jgi:hypothetical protein
MAPYGASHLLILLGWGGPTSPTTPKMHNDQARRAPAHPFGDPRQPAHLSETAHRALCCPVRVLHGHAVDGVGDARSRFSGANGLHGPAQFIGRAQAIGA